MVLKKALTFIEMVSLLKTSLKNAWCSVRKIAGHAAWLAPKDARLGITLGTAKNRKKLLTYYMGIIVY